MNIIFILFLVSAIVNISYLNKVKMLTAKKFYIFALLVIVLLFCFITDNMTLRSIIKVFLPINLSNFIQYSLNNIEYTLTFLTVISFVTLIQLFSLFFIINEKIKTCVYKNICKVELEVNKQIFNMFSNDENNASTHLNKVYICFCRLMN